MNKYKKKEIAAVISSLEKANEIIELYIKQKKVSEVNMLLIECQNAAISIGTAIEESEGGTCAVIPMFEEYCECLYQMSLQEGSEQLVYFQQIQKKLRNIDNWIRKNIVCKTEVVFLPYKAAMWDSMESVWKAVCADEKCECHVVPIPYYVKNTEGELVEFCYDGKEFPQGVPIEDYQEYSLEKKHPDVIIIHNAYDDSNYITSVHPDFYSTELKNYTELLVYIPYFVSLYDVGKHYCAQPGVLMADLVFVQSETVRKTYIDEYDRILKEYGLENTLTPGRKKIIALGSPKFDKAKSSNKDVIDIPEEWRNLLEQNNKRVVLYNTHLSGVMKTQCEVFFKNLETELEIFKNNKDILLLWRPHPLTESTAMSMNPAAAKMYTGIVKKYREGQWGIFDDTADLYRAITLADAYYGDVSSLVPLFCLTGKPTMVNRVNVKLADVNIEEEYCISDDKTCGEKIWEFIQRNV